MSILSLTAVGSLTPIGSAHAQNEDFGFLVEQAIRAPSGHNTQPWLFRIGEQAIEILPDFDRTLPVVDPDNRELFISLGCAAENLCVAAREKGYEPQVQISDEGKITIHLRRVERPISDPLFVQIAVRQTNRGVYSGRIIPRTVVDSLKADRVYFYENGTVEFDAIGDCVLRGNAVQMGDAAFKGELLSWMRFNKKDSDRTRDGLSYAVFGAPNLPRFIARPAITHALNAKTQNRGDRKKVASSSHFVLFTTRDYTPKGWVGLGRSLERFLLTSTGLGIAHAYMNQPCEIPALSAEMAAALGLASGERPAILLRVGFAERQPYSKRRSATVLP